MPGAEPVGDPACPTCLPLVILPGIEMRIRGWNPGMTMVAAALFLGITAPLSPAEEAPLIVGVHEKPPFAMKTGNGNWEGLAILLWRSIAEQIGVKYQFREFNYEDLIPSLQHGESDLIVGELHVQPQAERLVNFTQPYLTTAHGIAVRDRHGVTDWVETASAFINLSLLKMVGFIILGLVIFSLLIWLVERIVLRSEAFGNNHWEGIGYSMWFSAATMTSVGYGDKIPSTWLGRLLAFLWMLVGVIILATFTGTVASNISQMHYRSQFQRPSDLQGVRVGVLKGSDSETIARQNGARITTYEGISDGLVAVAGRRIDAFLGDRMSIAYVLQHDASLDVKLEDLRFAVNSIAMALPDSSTRLEEINVALLETVSDPAWTGILNYWLGPTGTQSMIHSTKQK